MPQFFSKLVYLPLSDFFAITCHNCGQQILSYILYGMPHFANFSLVNYGSHPNRPLDMGDKKLG
jgi:hypothetical protein